uniref:Uncharacterized protein n=1 Tax=Spironucleus salmonicida TaxID=348837 RepID=V6LPW9_9EUKA|eukprot:EST45756.1 Hypothetical protein SS50377_14327 [Spironucleus salmonicida]
MKNTWTPFQSPHNFKPQENKGFTIEDNNFSDEMLLKLTVNHFDLQYNDHIFVLVNDISLTEINDETDIIIQ